MQLKKENSDEILKIRVTKSEKEYIKQVADKKGITLTELVKNALDEYLNLETKGVVLEAIERLEEHIKIRKDDLERYKELNKVTDMTELIATVEKSLELAYSQKAEWEERLKNI